MNANVYRNLQRIYYFTRFLLTLGDSGHYYCGMKVLSCLCCDGICGPQHGCNCGPCQKIDSEEAARTTLLMENTMPAQQLIDSWIWGLQPCKKVYIIVFKYIIKIK